MHQSKFGIVKLPDFERREHLASVIPLNGKAVELGVAAGDFSEALLKTKPEFLLFSIDRWSDHHDLNEYAKALFKLHHFGARSVVMRATFAEMVNMFPDGYFDFIYIDGYAHTGQDGGQTLREWYPKLKIGGVFAGHDYDSRFQETIDQVNAFVREKQLLLQLTNEPKDYRSWYALKTHQA